MYRTFAIAALVLGIAGPAVANDGFARTVGVEPGKYTTSELVQIMFAADKATEMKMIEIRRRQAREKQVFLTTSSSSD